MLGCYLDFLSLIAEALFLNNKAIIHCKWLNLFTTTIKIPFTN